jgi:hypothetical protein
MRVHIRLPAPLGTAVHDLPPSAAAGTLLNPQWDAYLRTRSGLVDPAAPLSSFPAPLGLVELELVPRLRAGKGGFGANLRSAGGRMSANKSTNFDSCKDLNGRRLGTLKEAHK